MASQIRGYNRLSKLTHAKLVVVLQDDDLPPDKPRWLYHAAVPIMPGTSESNPALHSGSKHARSDLEWHKMLIPAFVVFLRCAQSAFSNNNRLGFIGGFTGTIQVGLQHVLLP